MCSFAPGVPKLLFLDLQKSHLYQLYGKNSPSAGKLSVASRFMGGKDFQTISCEMGITKATAEVYGIDCLAAGQPLDHDVMASNLNVTTSTFQRVRRSIEENGDRKLRTIRDSLQAEVSYNQIRFVLACMINDIEL